MCSWVGQIGLVLSPSFDESRYLSLPDSRIILIIYQRSLGRVAYKTFPLTAENDFLPDLDAIPEETARRAKFIYINYPNNPTGAV